MIPGWRSLKQSRCRTPPPRQLERVLPRAASNIDHGSGESPGLGDPNDLGLRPADIPRRHTGIHLVEGTMIGQVPSSTYLALSERPIARGAERQDWSTSTARV